MSKGSIPLRQFIKDNKEQIDKVIRGRLKDPYFKLNNKERSLTKVSIIGPDLADGGADVRRYHKE